MVEPEATLVNMYRRRDFLQAQTTFLIFVLSMSTAVFHSTLSNKGNLFLSQIFSLVRLNVFVNFVYFKYKCPFHIYLKETHFSVARSVKEPKIKLKLVVTDDIFVNLVHWSNQYYLS